MHHAVEYHHSNIQRCGDKKPMHLPLVWYWHQRQIPTILQYAQLNLFLQPNEVKWIHQQTAVPTIIKDKFTRNKNQLNQSKTKSIISNATHFNNSSDGCATTAETSSSYFSQTIARAMLDFPLASVIPVRVSSSHKYGNENMNYDYIFISVQDKKPRSRKHKSEIELLFI